MKNIIIILLSVYLICLYIPGVDSYNIPGKSTVPSDLDSKPSDVAGSKSDDKGDGGTKVRVYLPAEEKDSLECPIEVQKQTYPKSSDGYLLGDTIRILVEAKCMGSKLDPVQIIEHIDSNLDLINISDNTSKCYIVNSLPELVKFDEALNENDLTSFENLTDGIEKEEIIPVGKNTLYIQISNSDNFNTGDTDDLGSKGRIIYWYYVTPKNSGLFDTKTTIRLPEEYPDIDIPLDIDIRDDNPQFDTDLDVENLEADIDDEINLTYNILYLGGSDSPYSFVIQVDPSQDYNITGRSYMEACSNNTSRECIRFNTCIKYIATGVHYLPSISITGTGTNKIIRRYTFKSNEIEVNNWSQRHIDELSILATILAAMMATLVYEISKISKKINKNDKTH